MFLDLTIARYKKFFYPNILEIILEHQYVNFGFINMIFLKDSTAKSCYIWTAAAER